MTAQEVFAMVGVQCLYIIIEALFFEGKTEREYAKEKEIYHNAVHKKKIRILEKLKKILEN